MALGACGQTPIGSFDESSTKARTVKLWYDKVRQEVLRACWWTWATVAEPLTLLDSQEGANKDVPPDYLFFYTYPPKCLMLRSLFNQTTPIIAEPPFADPFYERETRGDRLIQPVKFEIIKARTQKVLGIATNLRDAWSKYTSDIDDPSQFDSVFVTAFASSLAVPICLPLTGDKELLKMKMDEAKLAMGEAKRVNLTEKQESAPRQSNYESARGT